MTSRIASKRSTASYNYEKRKKNNLVGVQSILSMFKLCDSIRLSLYSYAYIVTKKYIIIKGGNKQETKKKKKLKFSFFLFSGPPKYMRDQCRKTFSKLVRLVGWSCACCVFFFFFFLFLLVHMNNSTLYTLGSIKERTNKRRERKEKKRVRMSVKGGALETRKLLLLLV